MNTEVFVIGSGRTDFKRNFKKEGKTLRDIVVETVQATLKGSGISAKDIQAAVVGNFQAGLYTRQGHVGSLVIDADEDLKGIPTFRTEAACASGGVAVISGIQQIMSGLYDVVLVIGVEQQKTMSPVEGADVLAGAGDWNRERPVYGEHTFPKLFAHIAKIYKEHYGLTVEQLAAVVVKNYENARKNPFAQKRDAIMTMEMATTATEDNPEFAPPLKVSDCSQITDGGAGIVLASRRFVDKLGRKNVVKLLGFGHATDHLELAKKDAPTFSIARKAAEKAYKMAGLKPSDISAAEIHDCFSISELVQYEILGFAEPGRGARLIEEGATRADGRIPVNVSGGLIADGHPVGATGVRQVWEVYQQLTGSAGARQLKNLRNYLTFNMGGSLTTNVCMIWGK